MIAVEPARAARWCAVLVFVVLGAVQTATSQTLEIGIIDFYGLGGVSEKEARQKLTFKEGDSMSLEGDERPASLVESERRLSTVAGVARAQVSPVCCDAGRLIVYVGIEAKGRSGLHFREAPRGDVHLASDVVQAGREFTVALSAAAERGDAAEEDSQGHALFHDPATRRVQERFVGYAARDREQLRGVLLHSSDAEQRALAAQILAYVADKQGVVVDLVAGMSDPSEQVRNNAMRALARFAGAGVRVPYEPFIALLSSSAWSDRNKASLALDALTVSRDPDLLTMLRTRAMTPLIEMARWKSEGHAVPALRILGRIGGRSDEAIDAAWTRGERQQLINAALRHE